MKHVAASVPSAKSENKIVEIFRVESKLNLNNITMVWAYAYFSKSGKYDLIETSCLKEFNVLGFTKLKEAERAKVIFKAVIDGKQRKCQILALAG